MSRDTVAAFLHEITRNALLRHELANLAASHGFTFEPDELVELDVDSLTPMPETAGAETASSADDDPSDPGFGIIEIPLLEKPLGERIFQLPAR